MRDRFWVAVFCLALAACAGPVPPVGRRSIAPTVAPLPVIPTASSGPRAAQLVPVAVEIQPLAAPALPCQGAFSAHDLPHMTTVPGDQVEQFEANGAGVALGDLDDDGDLDIVLANHAGPNTILWNEGNLNFRAEAMPFGDSRAVNVVDVDADGRLDIVFTRRTGAINFLRNQGPQTAGDRFQQQILPGIARPAYAMAWGDLDKDGDLDLVAGSYDASLLSDLGNEFLLGGGAGVWVYENREGRFRGQQLASTAQAMAILLFDIDGDGWRDIIVGNDFAVPDYAWLRSSPAGGGPAWKATTFDATSWSTMSLDAGDVDNDGRPELFSTDMAPYAKDRDTVAAWLPLMKDMPDDLTPGDPQIMANVLQMLAGAAGYQNVARPRGLSATGWSWSAKFGDLDQDGLLDLYVVNGMAEARLLAHLPNGELIEANQALRNIGDGYFRPIPAWGLGSTRGGRGMSMGDLDGDGDLDIVVNNLGSPAQLFENRLCGGASLQVDLRRPDSPNSQVIGALVELETSTGRLVRDIRSGSGYLSGDPPRLHFGFPAGAELLALTVRWPEGGWSVVEDPPANSRLTVLALAEGRPLAVDPEMPEASRPAATAQPPPINGDLRAIIEALGLTGDPSLGRALPKIDEPLAQLGMNLFFSKALGGEMDTACASCHHPLLGGGDGLPLSIGAGAEDPDLLGPGRTHPSGQMTVARNAPTTFNVALWDQVLFHDGRVESLGKTPGRNGADGLGIRTPDSLYGDADPTAGDNLVAAQSRFPLTSPEEMRGFTFERHKPNEFVRDHLCQRLGAFGQAGGELAGQSWVEPFRQTFGEAADPGMLVSDANIAAALAAYQRSQVFVDTPWRAYIQGDEEALSPEARRGALLFFKPIEQGGANCAGCHSGDFFTDERFYVLALPQIGPGKDDGLNHADDYGRFRETGRAEDLYAFRTPSLLNVEVTGPYGHDGAYATLEGIIRHHLNPAAAVAAYDPAQLDPAAGREFMAENTARALSQLAENRRLGRPGIEDVALNDREIADLISFLLALTDPCVKDPACLAPWIPDDSWPDPDGQRLQARLPALAGD